MSLTTCNVHCAVFDNEGNSVAGALIRAKLNQYEVYGGYIVPSIVEGVTDADGLVVLPLWPNQLGSTESMYSVKIIPPTGPSLTIMAVVPNVSSTWLHAIAELPAYDGKTDGQLILTDAVAAGATAVAKAAEAAASATAAAGSATAASGSATTASTQAGIATIKAAAASTSETNAGISASSASSYATVASGYATTATTKAGEAASSATAAAGSATTATTKAGEAASSATAAAGSATTATTKAGEAASNATVASGYATTATTKAAEAANSASVASGYASTAGTSATAAAGSASAASGYATTATTKASEATASASAAASSALTASDRATAALSSATSASGSATTATTQAGIATTKASDASTSASVASGYATTATTNATAAAISASSSADSANASAASATASAGSAANALSTYTGMVGVYGSITAVTAAVTAAASSATASAGSAAAALAIYGSTAAMNTAVSTSTTNAATATTQAGNASTSATAAAASAASAAAIVTGVSSNRPSVRPSLLIDFAATGKLDPRITFGRSSPAMAYDGKTTVKAEENLLWYSQAIDNAGVWSKLNTTATGNYAVAPDGTTTAGALYETTTNATHYLAQSTTVAAGLVTVSVFLKKGDGANAPDWMRIMLTAGGIGANFNLTTGVTGNVASGATAAIASAGNGWYRCSITYTASAGSLGFYLGFTGNADVSSWSGYAGLTTSNVFVWGIQLEQRGYATAYTVTTGAAITNYIPALQSYAANVARFDFNPTTGESLGLMVEEQRTNLVAYSQDFGQWTANNVGVCQGAIVAPDGTLTGSLIYPLTTGTSRGVQRSSITIANSTAHTLSVYAKAGAFSILRMWEVNGSNTVFFDLSAGTVGTTGGGITASIVSVGNGWYRCICTSTSSSTSGIFLFGMTDANNNSGATASGNKGLYVWGAQLEAGAFATSYIPTLLTYSGRGSTGTYIGDNGLIQTAAANVARYQRNIAGAVQLLLEGAASNLIVYSANLNAGVWSTGTVAVNRLPSGVCPDGSMTGSKFVETTASVYHYVGINPYTFSAGSYVISVYAKYAGRQYLAINMNDGSAHSVVFDLLNGTVGTQTSAAGSMQLVGNGWYRLVVVATLSAATGYFNFVLSTATPAVGYAGDGVSGVQLWGAQLETGSVATSYIPSTETFTARTGPASYFDPSGVMRIAPSGLARYDFDPVTGLSKGLLVEASAANLLVYSSSQNAADWAKNGCSIAADAVIAPDGTLTADAIVEDTSAGNHRTYQSVVATSGATYTASLYVKANTITQISLIETTSGGVVFDLSALTASGSTPYTMTPVGNGWYRLSITFVSPGASLVLQVRLYKAGQVSYTGDGVSSAYVWGAQIELGSVATSYIPTTTAAVTRVADTAASVANSRAADVWSSGQATRLVETASMSILGLLNQTEWTMYAEAKTPPGFNAASNFHIASIFAAGANAVYNNAIVRFLGTDFQTQSYGSNGAAANQWVLTGTATAVNTVKKVAVTYATNNVATSDSGAAVATDTSAILPTFDTLRFGDAPPGATQMLNSTIKRIAIYPKRIVNTELQGLTS